MIEVKINEVFNTPLTDAEALQQANEKTNSEARAYLASTDWYIIRFQETSVAIPQEILDARANARLQAV